MHGHQKLLELSQIPSIKRVHYAYFRVDRIDMLLLMDMRGGQILNFEVDIRVREVHIDKGLVLVACYRIHNVVHVVLQFADVADFKIEVVAFKEIGIGILVGVEVHEGVQ